MTTRVLMELPANLLVRSLCERTLLAGGEYGGARYDAEHQGDLACHGAGLGPQSYGPSQ